MIKSTDTKNCGQLGQHILSISSRKWNVKEISFQSNEQCQNIIGFLFNTFGSVKLKGDKRGCVYTFAFTRLGTVKAYGIDRNRPDIRWKSHSTLFFMKVIVAPQSFEMKAFVLRKQNEKKTDGKKMTTHHLDVWKLWHIGTANIFMMIVAPKKGHKRPQKNSKRQQKISNRLGKSTKVAAKG